MKVTCPLRLLEARNGKLFIAAGTAASRFTAATTCPNCQLPFGLMFAPHSVTVAGFLEARDDDQIDRYMNDTLLTRYPNSEFDVYSDISIPTKIQETFICIQEDAKKMRNPAGILSGARGCLDVALKTLGETSGGRRDRIQSLAEKKIITQGIADWAQNLWEEGSDAVHDLDATIERAVEHVDFLKLFFEVCFALPAKIESASHGAIDIASDPS